MSNKLKKVFNNNDIIYKGTIHFKNRDALKEFEDIIDRVFKNGEFVRSDAKGIESISTGIETGNSLFSLDSGGTVVDFLIGPAVEKEHMIPLNIDGAEVTLPLLQYRIQDGIILETKKEFSFDIRMVFIGSTQEVKLRVTPRFERASTTEKLLEDIVLSEQLIDYFFADNSSDKQSQINTAKRFLGDLQELFSTLKYVEEQLEKRLDIAAVDITDIDSNRDLYELSQVLHGKAIRLNAKMLPSDDASIKLTESKDVAIGNAIALTYRSEIEYYVWNNSINLYTANLLSNAVVKSTKRLENGNTQIFYGDTDSKPMYISYKCFRSIEDATKELSTLMENKEEYENAKTVEQYWREEH